MEPSNIPDKISGLEIDFIARDHLKTITYWARIIAIVAFINVGINLVSTMLSPDVTGMGLGIVMVFMLVWSGIIIGMNVVLLRFANQTNGGLDMPNQSLFNQGIANLRTYFLIIGVLLIVGLSIFVLVFIFFGLGSLMR